MSDTFYSNDDLMQNIDSVGDDTTAIKDNVNSLAKVVGGLQAQLGNEVDALAKQNIQLKHDIKKLQIDMTFLIGVFKIANGLDKKAS